MYYDSILDLIGNTPLVKINKLNTNSAVTLLAKLEYMNPGGSVKDRIGIAMINAAEKKGLLKKGGTIIEPTSGNTGVGLAMVATLKGYKTVFVMPDKMSNEKRDLLRAYGAKVVIAPTAVLPEDEKSYYKVSDRLTKETKGGYKPDQYHNPANPQVHYDVTGPEIWEQTDRKITHFICGMGTGGTITGVGKFLKEKNPKIKIIGVDPIGSVYHEYKKSNKFPKLMKTYKVEGVGEDFIPSTIDFRYIDEVVQVDDRQSFVTARQLVRKEAILTGGSGGLAMHAALQVSHRIKKGLIVVLLPDSGKSYLTKIYNDEWMRNNGFLTAEGGAIIKDILSTKKTQRLISVKPEDTVKYAITLMKKYNISQLIVVDKKKLIGHVTEQWLLKGLYEKSIGPTNSISAVLDPDTVVISDTETVERAAQLLTQRNFVVVANKDQDPIGVITRIDLIESYV